ncbi:hypothetical protein RJT34_26761 [Clitoria ternatea]|uniref:Dof-type domain-containing protein n=1 Tax=Clitoria ternatea TaxID=43366 RepID=A0AAN9F732_CLITE
MSSEGDMSVKDPVIRLFGRKIPLPECQIPASSQMGCQIQANSVTMGTCRDLKKTEVEKPCTVNSEQAENSSDLREESLHNNLPENEPKVTTKPVEDNMETSNIDQEKIFKKPDKILHCPRCNSLDTKFCYFNNYNVNQPRHFCKNCQRYWTAGGTMRNVPVGAGRRKNKHLASQYQHIIIASDGIPPTMLEAKDSSCHQLVSTLETASVYRSSTDNGTVLKFGPDASPLCESMESMLNLKDQKGGVDANSINGAENGEEEVSLCGSSVTNACPSTNELSENITSKPLQSYPVPPWIFPWNPGWNNVTTTAAVLPSSLHMCSPPSAYHVSMQWCPMPMVAVPNICPPSFPLQFFPGPYWSGPTLWSTGAGTVSIPSNGCLSPSSSTSNSCGSGNGSPTLGKHTRDTVFTDEEKSDLCVLVPKTLRIDDPNEASKSPIWATFGIKPDNHPILEDAICKKVRSKEGQDRVLGMSQILEANPAAISRAHSFQESI